MRWMKRTARMRERGGTRSKKRTWRSSVCLTRRLSKRWNWQRTAANPGCHASGFIALVAPLVEQGLLARDAMLTCFSLTGYSGGGKNMIAEYEDPQRSPLLNAPRQYALGQTHKHLKEMNAICGLENAPVFCPIVADFYSGMEVTVSLFKKDLQGSLADVRRTYASYYTGPLIHFKETADENGFLSAAAFTGRDDMEVTVTGNEDRILLVSRFDNLGKGASGAAIQNMNIVLGLPEGASGAAIQNMNIVLGLPETTGLEV